MAERNLPGLGLRGFWTPGDDDWGDENDANLRLLSAIAGGQVLELVAAEPGVPADGDIVLLDEAHATHANELAVRDDGAWVYIVPLTGAVMFDIDAGIHRHFNGTDWKSPFPVATLQIQDGVTAPTATAGFATIYVDAADGDLKVIFADSTVKTIVVDT